MSGKYSERCGLLPAVSQVRNGFLEVAAVVVFTVNFGWFFVIRHATSNFLAGTLILSKFLTLRTLPWQGALEQ